jgi:hypothetical protein
MDSKRVNQVLRGIARPILKDHGFASLTERAAWRHRGALVDVITFRSFNSYHAAVMGCTTFSFEVTLGIYLADVIDDYPPKVRRGLLCPDEAVCPIRRHIAPATPRMATSPALWVIDEDGGNIERSVQEATLAIVEDGLPWFAALRGREEILSLLIDERPPEPGWSAWLAPRPGAPESNRLTGYVALAMGRDDEARLYLRRALSQWEAFAAANEWVRKDPSYEPRALKATVASLS